VIARLAGTVSSIGPSMARSTLRSASSGNQRSTASSRRNLHSSTKIIAATAVTGLVIEVIRKIVSPCIGVPPIAIWPIASTWISPPRLTNVTIPGISPAWTWPAMTSCMRPSRAFDSPPALVIFTIWSPQRDRNDGPVRRRTGLPQTDTR
jgi:hypothetical protein